jgi:hypothetical protein
LLLEESNQLTSSLRRQLEQRPGQRQQLEQMQQLEQQLQQQELQLFCRRRSKQEPGEQQQAQYVSCLVSLESLKLKFTNFPGFEVHPKSKTGAHPKSKAAYSIS